MGTATTESSSLMITTTGLVVVVVVAVTWISSVSRSDSQSTLSASQWSCGGDTTVSKMGPVVLLPVLLLVLLVVVVVVVIFRCIYIYTGANIQRHEATTQRDSPSPNNGWFVLLLLLLVLSSSSYDCMICTVHNNTQQRYLPVCVLWVVGCRFRFPMWILFYFASVHTYVVTRPGTWK